MWTPLGHAQTWATTTNPGTGTRWTVRPADPSSSIPSSTPRLVALSGSAPSSRLIPAGDETALASPPQTGEGGLREPADAEVMAARGSLPYLIRPSLGGGMPSGYVGGWGDYFIAGSAGTPGKLREGVVDGSVNMGLGFGDPIRSVGLEVYWGISSIKQFNAGGSVGFSAGRILVNQPELQLAVAGGLIDAFSYSNEAGVTPVNGYGAVTVAIPLQPRDPEFRRMAQFTVGGGGTGFAQINSNFQSSTTGYFMAAGVELFPNLGLSMGVSTRSKNVNLSFVPFRSLPIFVNLAGVDLFDETPWGTVGVLTVGWGDNLQRGLTGEVP
jgi:hypothetical protein